MKVVSLGTGKKEEDEEKTDRFVLHDRSVRCVVDPFRLLFDQIAPGANRRDGDDRSHRLRDHPADHFVVVVLTGDHLLRCQDREETKERSHNPSEEEDLMRYRVGERGH